VTNQEQIAARIIRKSPSGAKLARKIAKRQAIGDGWDGAANDNAVQAWPMAKALAAEGNTELMRFAMMYRRIYDSAHSGAVLGGSGVAIEEDFSYEQRIQVKQDGEFKYGGAVKRQEADDAAGGNGSNAPKPWQGDRAVNDMIDDKRRLADLRAKLGHLCEPFELACIDGATLQAVGNAAGIANRAGSMGAGRALVHTALITLRDCMGKITRADIAE